MTEALRSERWYRAGRVARAGVISTCRVAALALLAFAAAAPAHAQTPGRFLGREEILLYGLGLRVEPAQQTVPRDIATIVSTYLQAPQLPDAAPVFAPDAEVRATLRGPSFSTPQELRARPNTPFNIPPLTVPGTHTLENIRLVSNGEVILRGSPEQATIEVIERLLVTQVTARPLSAAEIREKGIVFDQSNFQAYNFSAAFAIEDRKVDINFPVLLPSLQGAADVQVGQATLPAIAGPTLPQLKTIIPDTLKLQTQIPNLTVIGFSLKAPDTLQGGNFVVPPIPGVIVIPGDIGFLNQFFSVMLMVGNVAPEGSGLIVSDLSAEIVLPPGRDTVVGTDDDPLRMARTAQGESPRVRLVVQPGPDGKLGTADDIGTLGPGETGNAEYLVEGRREGSHVVEMEITGTLNGLPVGPVQVRGRAAGSVLVRNPTFTLTFTHPEVVTAGEAYTLDVTVTNTSESPANFVQITLYPRNVSGATIVGDPTRAIESIAAGDSATVSFDLISRLTGKVTAATLDSDEKVAGRFELKTAVGELGVPLSPDSLVLPKEAGSLPASLRDAALGLLGKAWAVATAPAAALPKDVRRFSRKIVYDRAVEVAEAGFRYALREPLADSAAQLAMDFMGSNYGRLADLVKPADLEFEQDNFAGFDQLRRKSVRGDAFARAVGDLLVDSLAAQGAAAFHNLIAQKWSYRPAHLSVLASSADPLPVQIEIVDAAGLRVGAIGDNGKIVKELPFSDALPFVNGDGATIGQLDVIAAPQPGAYTVRLRRRGPPEIPYTISVVLPTADNHLRQVVFGPLSGNQVPSIEAAPGDAVSLSFELWDGDVQAAGTAVAPASADAIPDPPPSIISVIQQKDADKICDVPVGRVVAVLFSEEVTPGSAQDRVRAEAITNFLPEGNRAVGVALQPGRRIAFVALRDPIGPFIERQITIQGISDYRAQAMIPFTGPMETTVDPANAGVVSGRVVNADGSPIPYANVRLFYWADCYEPPTWVGVTSKSADADGRYSFDYVLRTMTDKIVAVNIDTDEFRSVPFNIQRGGQRLNVDIVFLGRGTFSGTTRSEGGAVLSNTSIRVTSLTDGSQYGALTDATGRFTISGIPVGSIFVEAVNTSANAKFSLAERIPSAGATVDRDITLLDVAIQQITVKHGTVRGHVLRADGATPVAGVPVFLWYTHLSQPGVQCPGDPPPGECAVAGGQTDAQGAFVFADAPAGSLRVSSFDQDGLEQGEARLQLVADGSSELNVLLVGGIGTVRGRVLTPAGAGVAGALVGGGLSIVTTNANGEFTLGDVPVGKREIVAVSQLFQSSGRVTIDLTRAGDTVNATIVLDPVASVSGTVYQSDGVTPVPNAQVYVFKHESGSINVVGSATTNDQGGYRIDGIKPGEYVASSFNSSFTDGNVAPVVLKFQGQVFRANIVYRGSGGRVVGHVFDDDGQTPLKAMVSLSGDRIVVAGNRVGVGFQHVDHFTIADTDFTTGAFALGGALVGPVTVSAVGQFSPDPIAVDTTIPSPNATVELNLQLQPTSQIRGVVLQPNGVQPVGQNVIVHFKSDAFKVICSTNSQSGEESCDSIPQGIQDETVVTDENGRFWLPVVNAGPFTINVEDPVSGKAGTIKGAVRAGDTAEVSVRLLGVGELTVRVFGNDAVTPIPGARVTVTQVNEPRKTVTGIADSTGQIVLVGADGFSEGDLAIEALDLRNGFTGRASARIARDGEQVSANVYLYDAVGTVYGRVYAPDGITAVANVEIVVSNGAGPLAFALTEIDGSYRVGYVPLGDVRVEGFEARTARRAAGNGRIDLAGQEVPINLTQAPIGIIKGRVLDSTSLAPMKGWTVSLSQQSPSGLALPGQQTTTGVNGEYSFPGSSRGTFVLSAHRSEVNGSGSASGTIEREGEVVDVPLLVTIARPVVGTISGVVLTSAGSPAANMVVEICHPARPCENPVALTTDAAGAFSLADVPLGRFQVNARSQVTREAGSARGELVFDGDIAAVQVILGGMSEVRGTVERSGGAMAAGVRVELTGQPDPGCQGACVVFTDANGAFAFPNVPANTFSLSAVDPLNGAFKGAAGGSLNPGETRQLRIVLTPAFALSGRTVAPGSRPAAGILADLVLDTEHHLYAQSDNDGMFSFPAVPPGTYQVLFSDPIGSGAAARNVTISADLALGDVLLDVAPPAVASSTPANAANGVPRNQAVRIVFSEPIRPGTIDPDNVSLTGPSGAIVGTLDVTDNDTVVTLTPLALLTDETRYTLRVRNVLDRVGKPMPAEYVATFTTVDITPARVVDANPAMGSGGVPIYTTVRLKYSESLDLAHFSAQPIVVTGPGGVVAGRTDYLFGNTVVVFTPNLPLSQDASYSVAVERAFDLAGNQQPQAIQYQFTTTDRTPPQIARLIPANGGTVVENGITSVVADVGAAFDVAVVDWYINDVLVNADRSAPFELSFRANPEYGTPGSQIRISAIATDTSGNRGLAQSTAITVTPDQAPALVILSPADGLAAHNGDHVVVNIRATDDLGITRIGYQAQTGNPADALTRPISPAALDRAEQFAFTVPMTAAPGTVITVQASAADTKGQVAQASIAITVLDSMPPAVNITGATSGARVLAGQQTTVVVTAQDLGRISRVTFTASGVVSKTETRTVDPAQPSIVTSFTVTVPTTAQPGQSLTLGASASDVAGNSASAAALVLPVADAVPPTVQLAPVSGNLNAVPGRTVAVVATASDQVGLTRIDLVTSGAVSFSDSKQVTPPTGSAELVFEIPVPANAAPGTTITVQATAVDLSNNSSVPAVLTLQVISAIDVVLPASDIVSAGESHELALEIAQPAPTGGLRIDFSSSNADVATATTFVTIPEGQTSAPFTVFGVSGGTAQIRAIVGGVPRTSMTVTVQGGIVTGVVRDSLLNPVAGAEITIGGGYSPLTTVTAGDGSYRVNGIAGMDVDVRALDPVTRFYGHATGRMARFNGYVTINVILIPAAAVHGTVYQAGGAIPAGGQVRVDIFSKYGYDPLATTFTAADGTYEFPLVTLGEYRIEASDTNGQRGRAAATLAQTGQQAAIDVTFLGMGSVTGSVLLASSPVPNATLTFSSSSIFGPGPQIVTNANADGTFTFSNVPVGNFSLVAVDPATGQAGSASGEIRQHQQIVSVSVSLANYGTVNGHLFRADGITPVAGAQVTIQGPVWRQTETDADGRYEFQILPLGSYTLRAEESSTRGYASASVAVPTHLATITRDLTMLPQGRLLVTVTDAFGAAVANAFVNVRSSTPDRTDFVNVTTGADGTVLVEHVLAGNVALAATFGALRGTAATVLGAGELRPVTIALEPTGSIAGTAYEAIGQAPAAGARVVITRGIYYVTEATTGADGAFRIDGLTLDRYDVAIYDAPGRLRARTNVYDAADDLVIAGGGQVVARDFTFVGLGTVTGRVFNPDSSSASDMSVQVWWNAPLLEGSFSTRTNAGGFYTFENVPVGGITVVAGDLSRQLYGERNETLAHHGDTLQVDIGLTSNAISLPRNLFDANNFVFDVQESGAVGNGSFLFYGNGTSERGAFYLDVTTAGVTTRVSGGEIPTIEDGNREIAVRQENVAGLSVTRKVFVPRNGYFARYLEIFRNPGPAPVTIDVALSGYVGGAGAVLARTSSGDAILDVSGASPDRWMVFGRADAYGAGVIFDDPAATLHVASASVSARSAFGASWLRFGYGWQNVTVGPGETVALMHFAAQQTTRDAAIASMQRLAQLPPEALAGLSSEEIGAIRNFALPAGGISTLAPLPLLTGVVTGRVFEGDGSTPSPDARVRFTSTHPLFTRQVLVIADPEGRFSFAGQLADDGGSTAVPVAPFVVQALHSETGVSSPLMSGAFEPDSTIAVRDITFTNAGMIRGIVRRHNGTAVLGGTVAITGPGGFNVPVTIGSGSSYALAGLPPGTYQLTATVFQSQGSPLTGTASATVAAGETVDAPITIDPTGTVAGVLRTAGGVAVPNVAVSLLRAAGFTRATTTDSGGAFTFFDVPLGPAEIRATDPRNALAVSIGVGVAQDVTTGADLQFAAVAPVEVHVASSAGSPAAGANVRLEYSVPNIGIVQSSATTDASGVARFENIPAGDFTLTAAHPANSALTVLATGTVTIEGQTVVVPMTFPAIGTLRVHVTRGAGIAVSGSSVQLNQPGRAARVIATDATGTAVFEASALGAFSVRAIHPANANLLATASGTLPNDGDVVDITLQLPAIGSVTGTVRLPDTSVSPGVTVTLRSNSGAVNTLSAVTDAQGVYLIGGVPAGSYTVTVEDGARGIYGTASGQITTDGETVTSNISLVTNIVSLARDLYDGNNFRFDIQTNGSLSDGTSDAYDGGLYLRLYVNGSSSRFSGSSTGVAEDGGREIAIRQNAVLGLDVVRKIYVPGNGYFARYLEVLRNPGTAPITVDASIETNLGSDGSTQVIATSSGDQFFDAADQWIVTDDWDASGDPSLAHVFGGANAARGLSFAQRSDDNLNYRWNGITIDPGQTVILMHFAAQHLTQRQVRAAAERLVQLPPEAIQGLSTDEAAQILNFAVPPDLSSPLTLVQKPDLGNVTGRVLAQDAATPVPSALVTFTSDNVLFGNIRTAYSDGLGNFTITGAVIDTYTLTARHPSSGTTSPAFNGSFNPGQLSSTLDVVFSNTGSIVGTVRYATGEAVSSGYIQSPFYQPLGPGGTFALTGLATGSYTVAAYVQHPQGDPLYAATTASVTAGQVTTADLALPSTGEIDGTVIDGAGQPAPYVQVRIAGPAARSTTTDAAGYYRFTLLPAGAVTVSALEPATYLPTSAPATVTPGATTTVNLQLIALGTVTGTVRYPDGSPAVYGYVGISDPNYSTYTYTDANGHYSLSNVPVNRAMTLDARSPAFNNYSSRQTTVTLTAHGQVATVDMTLPAEALLRIYVRAQDGTPMPYMSIYLKPSYYCCMYYWGYTNYSGYFDVQVTEGTTEYQTYFSGAGYVQGRTTVTSADHGRVIEAMLRQPFPVTVQGTVYAGDGATPLPNAAVQFRTADGTVLNSTVSTASGSYSATVQTQDGVLVVRASENFTGIYADQPVTVLPDNPLATVDVTVPVSIVRGTVRYSDGTPAPYPNVFATQLGSDNMLRTFYPTVTDDQGRYVIFALAEGLPFEVVAQDNQGLTGRANGQVASITIPLDLDVAMPPTGSVEGVLRNGNGAPLVDAWVRLTSPGLSSWMGVNTDTQGRYYFPRVPVGGFTLQACDYSSDFSTCESASGEIASANQRIVLDVRLASTGTVVVTLLDATGTPAQGSVMISGITRSFGSYWMTTAPTGRLVFTGVPEGTFWVAGEPYSGGVGRAEGTLFGGRTIDIVVTAGNAVSLSTRLSGTDTFQYDIDCRGRVMDGGTTDYRLYDAFDSTNQLLVTGLENWCAPIAATEENGRQLVIGPSSTFGDGEVAETLPISVTRKIYSPPAGGFVRYLEILTNTEPTGRQIDVQIAGNYGASASETRLLIAPAATGNTYAVLSDNFVPNPEVPAPYRPTIAHVFASAGAAQPPVAQFSDLNDSYSYGWQLFIPAGRSVALLHYTIQRENGDLTGIQAQAEALATLTDPAALEGLTSDERAEIVNFSGISGGTSRNGGSIEGSVFAADGSTRVPQAVVNAVDLATGRFITSTRTDADGRYRFDSLYLAPAGARVTAISPFDPNVSSDLTVQFASEGEAIQNVDFTLAIGAITGIVRDANSAPLASSYVIAARTDGGADTYAASVYTPDGRYAIVGVTAGSYAVSVFDPLTATGATSAATLATDASVENVDLQLPAVAACGAAPANLVGLWRGDMTAADSVTPGADGTLSGSASFAPGRAGSAFAFDGGDGLLTIPIGSRLDVPALTLEAWVAIDLLTVPSGATEQRIVYRGLPDLSGNPDFTLETIRTAGHDYFQYRMNLSNVTVQLVSLTAIEQGRFYHVAVTFDGGTARLYVDGVLEASQSGLGPRRASTMPVLVGRSDVSGSERPCNCRVDELQFHSRALSAAEVQASFVAGAAGRCTDLALVRTTIPAAYIGVPYSQAMRVVGGTPPFTFSLASGTPAPGIALAADGTLSGTPTATGSYSFDVMVVDGSGASDTASFTIECGTCLQSPSGLVDYWAAEGNALDGIGPNHGSIDGATFGPGVLGQAFEFNGSWASVQNYAPPLELFDTFTIEFWANPTATRPVTVEANSGISGTGGQRYAIAPEYRYTWGQANVGVSVGTNGVSVFEHGPSYLPSPLVYGATVSGWTHVAVVYQNRQPSLFLNGSLVRTGLTSTQQVFASKTFGDWWGYGYYQGALDEIAIYNRALSAAEVASIVNSPVRQRCPQP